MAKDKIILSRLFSAEQKNSRAKKSNNKVVVFSAEFSFGLIWFRALILLNKYILIYSVRHAVRV